MNWPRASRWRKSFENRTPVLQRPLGYPVSVIPRLEPRNCGTRTFLFLVCLLAVVPTAHAQSLDIQALVDPFYPADRLKPTTAAERQSCGAVLSDTAGSPSAVIAGYTTRSSGAIRILQRTEQGALAVTFDNPERWVLPGARCSIRLRDVDFDGRPEVFVSFHAARSSAGWVFKWDGSTLSSLTPVRTVEGRESSLLMDPTIYDLDHQGPLEIIAARDVERLGPGMRSRAPAFVYRLGASGFEVDGSLLVVAAYRGDVDPQANSRSFRLLQDSTGPFRMRLVNGDRAGNHRVTGVTVTVNELTIVEPRDVTASTEFASAPVASLAVQNHITATLIGPADATLLVLLEDGVNRK